MGNSEFYLEVTLRWTNIPIEILLLASPTEFGVSSGLMGPLGPYADFTSNIPVVKIR